MADNRTRGSAAAARSSREYFNAPRNADKGADGRRGRRILRNSHDESVERGSTPVIMSRPTTILAKPRDTSSQPENSQNVRILQPEPTSRPASNQLPTFQAAATIARQSASSPVIAKPSVSILSSSRTDKQLPPRSASTISTTALPETLTHMKAAIRLIGDNMEFTDYVQEYLSDTNTNFIVIGAIGPQGTGKSTLLSMLAGNDHQDMYRQYAFRPASREAVESCRFQSSKISIYVTKARLILLDCQAMFSAAILDEVLRSGRRGGPTKNADLCDGKIEKQIEIESIQLISFLFQVCHTVLLCIDWFIDIDVVRHVRTSEMFRCTPMPFASGTVDTIKFKPARKVNFVVIHQRAKSEDFYPVTLRRRSELLKKMFADSKLDLNGNVSLAGLNNPGYAHPSSNISYVPLADMKPRAKCEPPGGAPMSPNAADLLQVHAPIIDYEEVLRHLRIKIPSLPREKFVTGDQPITEKQWYSLASKVWRSTQTNADIAKFASMLSAVD